MMLFMIINTMTDKIVDCVSSAYRVTKCPDAHTHVKMDQDNERVRHNADTNKLKLLLLPTH